MSTLKFDSRFICGYKLYNYPKFFISFWYVAQTAGSVLYCTLQSSLTTCVRGKDN